MDDMLPVDHGDDDEEHNEQEHNEANPSLFGGNHEQSFLVQKLT